MEETPLFYSIPPSDTTVTFPTESFIPYSAKEIKPIQCVEGAGSIRTIRTTQCQQESQV